MVDRVVILLGPVGGAACPILLFIAAVAFCALRADAAITPPATSDRRGPTLRPAAVGRSTVPTGIASVVIWPQPVTLGGTIKQASLDGLFVAHL
jgi:hypothetical protein